MSNRRTIQTDSSSGGTAVVGPSGNVPPTYTYNSQSTQPVFDQKTDRPKQVVVKKGDKYYGHQEFECYPMNSKSKGIKGYVLIINMINYKAPDRIREGAEVDGERLRSLWEQLGFTVLYKKDLCKSDTEDLLIWFSNMPEHKHSSCLVVIVMAHGNQETISCIDEHELSETWVLEEFINDESKPHLHYKPKLFFIQKCRGASLDKGIVRQQIDQSVFFDESKEQPANTPPEVSKYPKWTDMLVVHSSVDGYTSYRDPVDGTWFISTLCDVFMEHACNKNVEDLLKKVAKEMAEDKENKDDGCKQMCTYRNIGLTEHIYFNPGW